MPIADEPHDDAAVTLRAIDWRSTFPFTLIFRSFRVAVHPSKLVLALVALLLIYAGGNLLDSIWKIRPQHRAVGDELILFEESRTNEAPTAWFNDHRNQRWSEYGRTFRDLEPRNKPNGLSDVKARILADRQRRVDLAHKQYQSTPDAQKFEGARERDRSIKLAYRQASTEWEEAKTLVEGVGLFDTFFRYELTQLNGIVRGLRMGNFLGRDGMSDGLVNLLVIGPIWAIRHHPFFFTIFGLWFLSIWSIFGGAIARIAAVHIARDEKISIRQALAFSAAKFLSFFSAPLIPLVIVGVVGLVVALGGALGNIPILGPIVVGGLFFLALIAGFIMTLVLLGAVGGINLMYPTIAVEGSDSFDAISRSFSYLYARPWRLAFYTLVALIYGGICYLFVRFFVWVLLWITHLFAGMFFLYQADSTAPLWNVMWPDPLANGRLSYDIDFLTLGGAQDIGAFLLAFWVYLTISMLGAFAISMFFSANTVIYYLMRNEVDATELDDVYLEQGEEDFMDSPAADPTSATTTAPMTNLTMPSQNAAIDSVGTGTVTTSDNPPPTQSPENPQQG